jgi:hypothetical protein
MIMRIPIDGGEPDFTGLRISSDVQQIVSSADGTRIALVSRETTSELWALDHVLSALK